ncbi:MAG TPA: hypothetical protein VGM59_17550 [Dongiaceae bacterium]|jgi:hypothetical protein
MISFPEFSFALQGLARLARFDAGFSSFFDLSQQGARRSFWLAVPFLPFFLVLELLNARFPAGTDIVRVYSGEIIGYALSWIAFPLTLLLGARLLDRGPRIFATIVVYNWLWVLAVALYLPITIAQYLGLDAGIAAILHLCVLAFTLACEWFAFRRLLDVGIQMTVALVVVDFAEGQIILNLMALVERGPLF